MTVVGIVLAFGLSTALVAALNAVRFPRAGVPDPESLLWVRPIGDAVPGPAGSSVAFSPAWTHRDFEAMRDGLTNTTLASLVAVTRSIRIADGQARDGVQMAFVSGGFFAVAGVRPELGRLLDDLWGEADALGASLRTLSPSLSDVMVIGIVGDAVTTDLLDLSRGMGTVYRPLPPSFLPHAAIGTRATLGKQPEKPGEPTEPSYL